MITTTTAIQINITPDILKQSLWSIIGLNTSGKLIFLPMIEDDVTTEDSRFSEKGVKAKDILSYIESLDG